MNILLKRIKKFILIIFIMSIITFITKVYARTVIPVEKDGIRNVLHFNLSSDGVLTWDEVPEETKYNIEVYPPSDSKFGAYSIAYTETNTNEINLIEFLDGKKLILENMKF